MLHLLVVNVVSTLVAIIGVDRVGRRFLFIVSGIIMVICEVVVALCLGHYFNVNHGVLPDAVSNGVLAVICFYVANFAWSWGELSSSTQEGQSQAMQPLTDEVTRY